MNKENPRIREGDPDLEFIAKGTKNIWLSQDLEAEFCPHLERCPHKNIDTNCFYNKFLYCDEARELEKTDPLNPRDAHFLRYRGVGI